MKANVSLRFLGVIGFLLLMAPFYDQCNGRGMMEKAAEPTMVENIVNDTLPSVGQDDIIITNDSIATNFEESKSLFTEGYDYIDDPDNQNAFELADLARVYLDMSFAEFKAEIRKELAKKNSGGILTVLQLPIRSLTFVLIVLISFLLMILVFTKKYIWVYKMTIANLILLLITIIFIVFFDTLFDTFRQIKWGYYAFILIQIALVVQSKRMLKSSTV